MIRSWPVVQYDSETTGLDCHICKLRSMQFGYKDFQTGEINQIVVDCESIDPAQYKDVIEQSYLIGHNLKFDIEFLYNHGIIPRRVYDTMIAEKTLYLGYKPSQITFNLHDVLYRYTGIELDKTFQKNIARRGLTHQGIVYSANDVVHLQDIRRMQMNTAKARNCEKALYVENRFVPAIAYLEWCGVHLDENKWKAKMASDQQRLDEAIRKLNEYVSNNTKLNQKYVSSCSMPSLFDENPEYTPTCTVDWASSRQLIPLFQDLGFNTKTIDKETKKERDSVEENLIINQKGIADEFLDIYFSYKEAEKNVTTYGQGHLNQINPITGRIHTNFNQIGTVTGRMSSGSKSKNTALAFAKRLNPDDVSYCNLQNLPARGEAGKITRSCFTSMPGNVFISCDYSAEESRVQADVWNEKSLLDAFKNGIDTHNLYAKLCFPEELKDVDVRDVKAVRPDLRQAAKSAEFAVSYGSNGSSIADNIGMPREKAMDMVAGILKGMPGMAKFKKNEIKFLKKNGYIVINPITGHRIYWPEWSQWKSVEDTLDKDFWDEFNAVHKGTGDSVCAMLARHNNLSKDWFDKNVLNYPIQGGSAIVLKQAAADLFDWVVKKGYFGIVLFCVFVHDEIDVECPQSMEKEVCNAMETIMEKASGKYYKKLKIPAEATINTFWEH